MTTTTPIARSAIAMLGFAMLGAAHAQNYPTRTVRIVVGYQPGGAADMVSRLVANGLTDALGQQVIVDNRPGAGGFVANESVAKSQGDGYTLLLANSSFAYIPGMFKKTPFDLKRDFTPVAMVAMTQNVVVVHPAVPARSIKELVALARAQPGKLNYASGGTGGSTHMATELFRSMTDTKIVHIPYKGNGPSIVDLVSGQVDMTIAPIPAMLPFVTGQKPRLRALATTGAKRARALPDLPTVAEAGVAGYEAGSWYGYMVPSSTPAPIVAKLEKALVAFAGSSTFADKLQDGVGAEPAPLSSADFREHVARETEKWGKIIRAAGIKAR